MRLRVFAKSRFRCPHIDFDQLQHVEGDLVTVRLVLSALALTALGFGPIAHADEPVDDLARVREAVQRMLESGIRRNGSLTSARAGFERASRLAPDDPRVSYGWALVLLHHDQRDLAAEQFKIALKHNPGFLFASNSLAWLQMLKGDDEAAVNTLTLSISQLINDDSTEAAALASVPVETQAALSEAAVGPNPEQPQTSESMPDRSRQVAVKWMAECLGAIASTSISETKAARVRFLESRISAALTAEFQRSFATGRASFRQRNETLQAKAEKLRKHADASLNDRVTERQDLLGDALDRVNAQSKDTQLKRQDAEVWLDEALQKIDRELGRLERDYQFLSRHDARLKSEWLTARQSLTRLELRPDQRRNLPNPLPVSGRLGSDRFEATRLRTQLLGIERNLNAVSQRVFWVTRRAQSLLVGKRTAITKYEKATGSLLKQQSTLGKWQQRIAKGWLRN